MNLTIPDAIHGGDRGTMGRTPRPKSRMRPYQPLDARRGSWTHDTTGQLQSGGSSVGFSPVASSDESRVEDSGSATSPGTESDTYYNIPDTPAENHGAPPEGPDEATLVRTTERVLSLDFREPVHVGLTDLRYCIEGPTAKGEAKVNETR